MDESSVNPYQSPISDSMGLVTGQDIDGFTRPGYKLYSVGSVTLATFLGSLLAGGILMAINYRRLGQVVAATHAIVWSLAVTICVIVLLMLLPEDFDVPNTLVAAPQIIGMYFVAKTLQGPAIADHRRQGGTLASAWGAAGIAILTGLVLLAGIFALAAVLSLVIDS